MKVIEMEKKPEMSTDEQDVMKWLKQLKKYRTFPGFTETRMTSRESTRDISEPEKDFETMVREEAYFISLNNLSMDELTWLLAERKLSVEKGYSKVSENDIRTLAEKIHHSGLNYDELCWLNAEIMVMYREHYLE